MRLYQRTKASTHYIAKALGILVISCALTACFQKTLPIADDNPSLDWVKRKQRLQSLSHWTLRGKAAFQSQRDSGSASFEWQQQKEHFSFAAFSPLGNEEFRLQGSDSLTTLRMANGKEYQAANSEQLFLQTLGIALPLSSLTYWVRGIPDPRFAAKTQFDTSHRLLELQQANWQVNFQNYTTIDGIDLPRFITMSTPLYKTKVMIY